MHRPRLRTLWRILALAGFAVTASQTLPGAKWAMFPSALSPLSSLLGSIAGRHLAVWSLLGLPLLVLALLRGRWFCHHLCPTGSLAEWVGRRNPRRKKAFIAVPHLGRWLALLCVGGALAGYPLFVWLDPLAVFSGALGAWKTPWGTLSLLPAAGFVLILLLSLFVPQVWCFRLCPLGAVQDLLGILGKRLRGHRHEGDHVLLEPARPHPAFTRRAFIAVAAGGFGGWVMRCWTATDRPLPIRPPGAVEESRFTGLCARCGNCSNICPMRVIQPDLGATGLAGLLTPTLHLDKAYCDEWCNECAKVCPTGAIRHVDLETKRHTAIGLAEIHKRHCLAWNDGEHCMVCQEYCPYLAVQSVMYAGVNCPEVDANQCRGCGACQANCPALPQKAIIVHGAPQHPARPLPDDSLTTNS